MGWRWLFVTETLPQEGSGSEETDASCLALRALGNWEGPLGEKLSDLDPLAGCSNPWIQPSGCPCHLLWDFLKGVLTLPTILTTSLSL